jgi:hypothetical protein
MAVPRTRIEQVAELRPPIGRVIWHYAYQAAQRLPHSRWMLKWISLGVLVIITNVLMFPTFHEWNRNKEARQVFEEKQAKIEEEKQRKKDAEAKKEREAKDRQENDDITARAIVNWEQWKQAFVGPELGVACYHGHDFKATPKTYNIKCSIGPKGQPPNLTIVCNQDICGTPPSPPPPEKK